MCPINGKIHVMGWSGDHRIVKANGCNCSAVQVVLVLLLAMHTASWLLADNDAIVVAVSLVSVSDRDREEGREAHQRLLGGARKTEGANNNCHDYS